MTWEYQSFGINLILFDISKNAAHDCSIAFKRDSTEALKEKVSGEYKLLPLDIQFIHHMATSMPSCINRFKFELLSEWNHTSICY